MLYSAFPGEEVPQETNIHRWGPPSELYPWQCHSCTSVPGVAEPLGSSRQAVLLVKAGTTSVHGCPGIASARAVPVVPIVMPPARARAAAIPAIFLVRFMSLYPLSARGRVVAAVQQSRRRR